MKAEVLAYLPEAIEALIGAFRGLRNAREARSAISYLRGLGDVERSDIDEVKRRLVSTARHTEGTGGSD